MTEEEREAHQRLNDYLRSGRPSELRDADIGTMLALIDRLSTPPSGPVEVEYDGFAGDVIGSYVTREGKRGVVVQQHGTRVVHVYREDRVKARIVGSIETLAPELLAAASTPPSDAKLTETPVMLGATQTLSREEIDRIVKLTPPSVSAREIAERIVTDWPQLHGITQRARKALTDAITSALDALAAEKDAEIERLKASIKDAEETSKAGWQENHDCEQLLFAAEAQRDRLAEALNEMLRAIETGNIDSPEIAGLDDGIPTHRWHEEWAYHTRAALSEIETKEAANPTG